MATYAEVGSPPEVSLLGRGNLPLSELLSSDQQENLQLSLTRVLRPRLLLGRCWAGLGQQEWSVALGRRAGLPWKLPCSICDTILLTEIRAMQLFDLLNWHYWLGAVKNPRLALQTATAILKYPNLFIATRGVEGRIPPPVGVLLYESVLRSGSTAANIVEVGAFKGLSTIYLAKAAQTIGKRVKSFDLFSESPRQLEEFESNLERRRVRDVVDVKIG